MPQHSVTLESPFGRIKLIPPVPSDDEAAAICRTHPTTRRYLSFLPENATAENMRVRRESRAEDPHLIDFHIHFVQNDGATCFAGHTGFFNLDEQHSTCEAGIIVSPKMHGKHLATETLYVLLQYIFEERNIHRTTFETSSDNVGMQSWLENVAGARLEAQRKETWKLGDGTFGDVKGYAILDWEWKERVKKQLEARLRGRV
ncbi:acyl-CoA N-acyltransferase [Crassisporium funariophilum]|nr:acyl-CoA N-acyltransferase [Crassisporium funariophilum]